MSSGSTVLRFDLTSFDGADLTASSSSTSCPALVADGLDADLGRGCEGAVLFCISDTMPCEHPGKRLVHRNMPRRLHRAGEENANTADAGSRVDAANILVDSISGWHRRRVGAFSFHGSVKRAKYHDESTNVSIVSVLRVALPPHCGQVTLPSDGGEGVAGFVESLFRQRRASLCRHRHHVALRQWMTGIGQPQRWREIPSRAGSSPAATDRCIATRRVFKAFGDIFLRGLDGHAIEEGIDHPPVAVIGGGNDRDFGSTSMTNHGVLRDCTC